VKAIILAVGDELVSGETVDTNSAYLAGELGLLGIETLAHRTVGDDEEAITAALLGAAAEAPLVLVTGGLGPTQDDLTRHALARAMGSELALDEACLAEMEAFFARRGRTMVEANHIQAMIPAGAETLANSCGTAAGIAARLNEAMVYVMPGVPMEMREMFAAEITPRLPRSDVAIVQHLVHAYGTGESNIGATIGDLMADRKGPVTVGTTVAAGLITVRITARAATADEAEARAEAVADDVRRRLGKLVVGEGDVTMAPAIGGLLSRYGRTLATAESCTGGMIGRMITDAPGASAYYVGGIVAYANEVKIAHLGVPAETLAAHGAVSEEVAEAMARGCRSCFATDWAVSVTGIAGPGGGTEDKPVGLVYIALAGPDGCTVHRHVFPGPRDQVRHRTATAALNHLRLALLADAE